MEILLSNTWQENLNTWIFKETVILIKDYATPNFTKVIGYSIERSMEGNFLVKTNHPAFGILTMTVNYENALPKIFLQSINHRNIYFELHAFNSFSSTQKSVVENRLQELKALFEQKQNELMDRIFHLKKTTRADKKNLINEYESFIHQTNHKIEMIEMIVRATVNVASDFELYMRNLESDIDTLAQEIKKI